MTDAREPHPTIPGVTVRQHRFEKHIRVWELTDAHCTVSACPITETMSVDSDYDDQLDADKCRRFAAAIIAASDWLDSGLGAPEWLDDEGNMK